jgi:hypothetical protein
LKRKHFKNKPKKELAHKVKRDYYDFLPAIEKCANKVIYVAGKTPEQIIEEIIKSLPTTHN